MSSAKLLLLLFATAVDMVRIPLMRENEIQIYASVDMKSFESSFYCLKMELNNGHLAFLIFSVISLSAQREKISDSEDI